MRSLRDLYVTNWLLLIRSGFLDLGRVARPVARVAGYRRGPGPEDLQERRRSDDLVRGSGPYVQLFAGHRSRSIARDRAFRTPYGGRPP